MPVICVGGMIGIGKTSVAELLAKELGSDVFYESVDDNPILPLFYTASPEEIQAKRYPFLLQLYFLQTRFASIKEAYKQGTTSSTGPSTRTGTSPRSITTWAGSAPSRCRCTRGCSAR